MLYIRNLSFGYAHVTLSKTCLIQTKSWSTFHSSVLCFVRILCLMFLFASFCFLEHTGKLRIIILLVSFRFLLSMCYLLKQLTSVVFLFKKCWITLTYFCRLMTAMSSHYNLILIETMENIFLQMQIEVLEISIRFTGNLFIMYCSNYLNGI